LCLEDKIVQQAVVYVLEAIYEEDFLGFSYGFRPERGQHDALDALHAGIYRKQVNWVLDSDIQGFFDAMAHSWTIRFLQHRIADKRILRLIAKWLKVGITEDGRVTRSERGTPQRARFRFDDRIKFSKDTRLRLALHVLAHFECSTPSPAGPWVAMI